MNYNPLINDFFKEEISNINKIFEIYKKISKLKNVDEIIELKKEFGEITMKSQKGIDFYNRMIIEINTKLTKNNIYVQHF